LYSEFKLEDSSFEGRSVHTNNIFKVVLVGRRADFGVVLKFALPQPPQFLLQGRWSRLFSL
jgi:hypothetical protein